MKGVVKYFLLGSVVFFFLNCQKKYINKIYSGIRSVKNRLNEHQMEVRKHSLSPKLNWLCQKASSLKARLMRCPSHSRVQFQTSPRYHDMLRYMSLYYSNGALILFSYYIFNYLLLFLLSIF